MEIIRKMTWTKIKFLIWAIVPPFLLGIFLGILYFCLSCSEIRKTPLMILLTYILIIITYELLIFAYIPLRKELKYDDICRKGHILYHLGKYEAAAYCFETAKEYIPEIISTYYVWGNALGELGKEKEDKFGEGGGRKFFEEALLKYKVIVGRKQKEEVVIEDYEKVKKEQKEYYWQACYGRANMFFNLKQFDNAVKEFRKIKSQKEKLKENAKCIIELEDLERKINFVEVYYGLGNTLAELGKKQKKEKNYILAVDYYNEAIDEYNKTDFLDAKKNLENAKKEVEELNRLISEEKTTKSL